MPKKAENSKHIWQKPSGYFVSAFVLWAVGYILLSLAIDSGSILQWLGAIVTVLWGIVRFITGITQYFSSKRHDKR